ncbi:MULTISPECIES: lipopolysaccharide transport periplasmic protein LptA [Helicobacter]|uniref:lipopolysaccharide transport periplasmic protein LptA n=1 Tax=Helicobacter sp. L8 TaxID=2316078 RepID=UPI000EB2F1EE|nr:MULTISPECIES: lipopolysaccharide transport periplasmic protein LptA [Helicobacter]
MVKWGVLFLALALLQSAPIRETLEVIADKFLADDKKHITTIEGHVHIKKGKDTLNANKVIIYTNAKRKPVKYEAMGAVQFHLVTQDGREVEGHSDRLIYDAIKQEYRLLQNAVVNEVGKINSIKGEEIILSKERGYADVLGGKDKPARFVFDMDDIQQEQKKQKQKKAQATKQATQSTPKQEAHESH